MDIMLFLYLFIRCFILTVLLVLDAIQKICVNNATLITNCVTFSGVSMFIFVA